MFQSGYENASRFGSREKFLLPFLVCKGKSTIIDAVWQHRILQRMRLFSE